MAEVLTVNLNERSYSILLGHDLTPEVKSKVAKLTALGRKIAVVTDQNIVSHQSHALHAMFGDVPTHVLPPGEETKSLTQLGHLLDFLASKHLDRTSALFVVGGGVVGDLGGFAAASYLRGIDYYQIPTTLLSMVDSSVGGKTGINLKAGKNLAGAFYQPKGVFISTAMLGTLPPREFAAGMAEVIKNGLLGDTALFAQLEQSKLTPKSPELATTIRRCCAIKAHIVEADERELAKEGGRALLNLGHTFAHAIEQATGYSAYLHGEAVAIGLCAAARLSVKLDHLDEDDVERVETVVTAHGLPKRLKHPLPMADLLAAMARDKKVREGMPRFVILRAFGAAAMQSDIEPALVEASFHEIGAK